MNHVRHAPLSRKEQRLLARDSLRTRAAAQIWQDVAAERAAWRTRVEEEAAKAALVFTLRA